MDGTKSLSELLAYLLVAAMAAALLFPFVAPVFRRWAGTARASRLRAALSAAMLLGIVYMGGSLDKQQSDHMHHDAKYELRSETIDQHGNQATFDANGDIITTTIAAGTADYYQPFNYWGMLRPNGAHRRADVLPYVRALQLDGNPGHPSSVVIPANITRPCLYQGENLDNYLYCRPCVH